MAANKPKTTGRHPDIEAIDRKLHELQSKSKHKERWQDDVLSKAFSAFKQTLIIESALEIAAPESFRTRSAFAGMLFMDMQLAGTLPRKKAGKGVERLKVTPWDEGTFTNYLRDGTVKPTPEEIGQILDTAIALADLTLRKKGRQGQQLQHILAQKFRAPSECLDKLLANLAPAPPEAFTTGGTSYASVFLHGFDVEPRATWSRPLEETAEKIRKELVNSSGARLILVAGPHLSGKKTSLKFLCKQLKYGLLHPDDGSQIPLLALSLDDLGPGEFVDAVFTFFRKGDPYAVAKPESDEGLTVAAKIEQIQRLSKSLPACVILADVAPLENDELIRSLHQDHVAQIIMALFEGEPRTRIVLTAHENDQLQAIEQVARHKDIKKATFPLDGTVKVDPDNLRVLEDARTTGFEVSGITSHLADIALRLAEMRRGVGVKGFRHRILRIVENDSWTILDVLWTELLEPHERFLLGAVASSFDGLRISLVARMARTLVRLRPESWIQELTTEHSVEKVIENLTDFMQIREAPLDLGQSGWREPSKEALLFMDQGWRRRVLSLWFKHDDITARQCRWLVAREAAKQARTFKVVGGLVNAKNAFGRDLQSFDALISSIDPEDVAEPAEAPDAWSLESRILPDLDEDVPKPPALTVLRYAFQRWYADYLEGADFRLLSELDDPDLRLRLLLPFFDPSNPWIKLDERRLHDDLDEYPQIEKAFPGKKLLPLLTAIALAALRVQRFDLLRSAVRIGEQVLKKSDFDPDDAWMALRLLRAEIDAGLYAGGNPDDALPMRPGMKSPKEPDLDAERARRDGGRSRHGEEGLTFSEIIRRIKEVISRHFAPKESESIEMLVARGKMLSRLGEAYHMSGRMPKARLTFAEVMACEERLAAAVGEGCSTGAILGGRGVRACLSWLVDNARRRQWIRERPMLGLSNGLILPLPPIVAPDDALLGTARALLLINLRRIGAFDTADRLGVRMDEARLAAARGEYLSALEQLKETESARLRPGANVELSMELHALQTRILLEAALLMTQFETGSASERTSKLMVELRQGWQAQTENESGLTSDDLVGLAEQSLRSLQKLVSARKALTLPFGTLFRYFDVWLNLLKLTNCSETELPEKLCNLLDGPLNNVIIHMDQAHFNRFAQEAELLRWSLQDGLARRAPT